MGIRRSRAGSASQRLDAATPPRRVEALGDQVTSVQFGVTAGVGVLGRGPANFAQPAEHDSERIEVHAGQQLVYPGGRQAGGEASFRIEMPCDRAELRAQSRSRSALRSQATGLDLQREPERTIRPMTRICRILNVKLI